MELFFGLIALVAVGYLVYHANTSKKEVKPVEATPEAKPVVEATSVVADAAPAKPAKKKAAAKPAAKKTAAKKTAKPKAK